MGVFCLSDFILCQGKQVVTNICLSGIDSSLLKDICWENRHFSLNPPLEVPSEQHPKIGKVELHELKDGRRPSLCKLIILQIQKTVISF